VERYLRYQKRGKSKMSRLNRFVGKPKEITIEDETFIIHPLCGKDLPTFMNERTTPEEQAKLAIEMIYISLLPSEPDITREEIQNLPVSIFNQILLAINDVNGMGKNDKINLIKKQIEDAKQTNNR
jgi:hypothetical protein